MVEQAFTPTGFPPRTAPEGLYLLEGASITRATLEDPATENGFAVANFPAASFAPTPAPKVNGWIVVQKVQVTPPPFCSDGREFLQRTGSATNGRVTGFTVMYCWANALPGQQDLECKFGRPTITMEADVTFAGAVASGSITLTYLFYTRGAGGCPTIQQKIARLNFQAGRVP